MQRPAGGALVRVQRSLAAEGYGLLVHDAYRPWYRTKIFRDATPPDKHNFVADPATDSRHNRGWAVDLTLHDLHSGRVVEMPTLYEAMSERAWPTYPGSDDVARHLRDLLRQHMPAEAFAVYQSAEWHVDFRAWESDAIQHACFENIMKIRCIGRRIGHR